MCPKIRIDLYKCCQYESEEDSSYIQRNYLLNHVRKRSFLGSTQFTYKNYDQSSLQAKCILFRVYIRTLIYYVNNIYIVINILLCLFSIKQNHLSNQNCLLFNCFISRRTSLLHVNHGMALVGQWVGCWLIMYYLLPLL